MIKLNSQILEKNLATHQPIGFKKSFLRALLTSITATSVDFILSVVLKEWIGIYYVTATTLGGMFGAATSFLMGRIWVFNKRTGRLSNQLLRFVFTNFFSIFLNTSGVFFIVEHFEIPFVWSRIVVACFVGFFFNFLMNRYFVFRS
ncbi:MAG: GtrA family protein [Saprospiraceae bacterium]|nr:GtrA family protein [Saprospiraceae bacterium]